jgi:DNA adenine methylase
LQSSGYTVFYDVRKRFNENNNPEDLFFLSRTCVNGLIRFNSRGEFNNSLHHTRKGIKPSKITNIINDWSKTVQNVKFVSTDYKETLAKVTRSDFVYMDPPYFNTKGRYYGKINYDDFMSCLHELVKKDVRYVLSYDGIRGENVYLKELPKNLYTRHLFLNSGNSSFKKVMDKKSLEVFESVYLNF